MREASGEVLLLGDFNSHHPHWGGTHAASEPQAEHLLTETSAAGLHLTTPRGDPTWKRGNQESVINLTFASGNLWERISYCGTENRWALTRDHIPIRIQIDAAAYPQTERQRYAV